MPPDQKPPPGDAASPEETAPAGMIDLHCHLLPGVDDGATDLEEALAMCRLAAVDGCAVVAATPHLRHEFWWNGDRAQLEDLYYELRDALPGEPEVLLGGEIAVNSQSVEEIYALPEGELLTLAGTRYLLLELDYMGLGPNPVELIRELTVSGWYPVVAHPERFPWLAGNLPLVAMLVEHGAHLQLTARSITGELGRAARRSSEELLDAGLVELVSSDAHGLEIRPPGLSSAYRHVGKRWGEAIAEKLFVTNPRAVVDNRPLRAAAGERAPVGESVPSPGGGED
ncbi:MAG: hypothetical protein GY856_16325 [bacterium]|nr:hypothetical protein [bacterium]